MKKADLCGMAPGKTPSDRFHKRQKNETRPRVKKNSEETSSYKKPGSGSFSRDSGKPYSASGPKRSYKKSDDSSPRYSKDSGGKREYSDTRRGDSRSSYGKPGGRGEGGFKSRDRAEYPAREKRPYNSRSEGGFKSRNTGDAPSDRKRSFGSRRDEKPAARRNTGRFEDKPDFRSGRSSAPRSGGFKPRKNFGDEENREFKPRGRFGDKSEGGFRREKPEGGFKPRGRFGDREDSRPAGRGFRKDADSSRPTERRGRFGDKPDSRPVGRGFRKDADSSHPTERRGRYGDKPDSRPAGRGFRKDEDSARPTERRSRYSSDREERAPARKPRFGGEKSDFRSERKPAGRFSRREDEKPARKERKPKKSDMQRPENFKGSMKVRQKAEDTLLKSADLSGQALRINRYIAMSGICSRREADEFIAQGKITLNGEVVTEPGIYVNPKDRVEYNGHRVVPEKPVYILLNKPKGFITTTDDPEGRATVMELIDLEGKERIFPVGRLDRNTTGVLLLTNDGDLAQVMTHPKFEIKKIYRAKLDREPSKEDLLAMVEGIELEDGFISVEQVGFVEANDNTVVGLEIHSGRNRIVRRIFEHLGYEVKSLDRVMFGDFDKLKLGRGKWRFLDEKEMRYIQRLKSQKSKKSKTAKSAK